MIGALIGMSIQKALDDANSKPDLRPKKPTDAQLKIQEEFIKWCETNGIDPAHAILIRSRKTNFYGQLQKMMIEFDKFNKEEKEKVNRLQKLIEARKSASSEGDERSVATEIK